MNRDDSRRAAKDLATAALQNLYTAFSGDGDVQNVVASVLEQVSSIDVKPQVPALGAPVVVIGDAVAAPPHIAALESTEESSAPRQNKRQRRTANVELTLQNFPPNGCEVLIPRHDGQQRWNQYCRVVGHTATGQLVIDVPGESAPLERSIYGLRGGLGSDEERPLMRTCSSREAGLAPLPQSAEEQAATAHPHPSSGTESSSSVAAASSSAVPAPASASFPSPTIDERSGEEQAATSKLRRSEGRTREELNRHLADLGLKAKFGQTVVSAKEGVLSHLTFNVGDWNNLPQTEQEPFIWWLGDGEKRLRLANHVNPDATPQPIAGVPVFFAVKRKQGGALCYYGGHFTTASFVNLPVDQRLMYKDRHRQARIELRFHHFQDALAAAVNATERSWNCEM